MKTSVAKLNDKDDKKCHCVEKMYNTVQKPYRESWECTRLYFLLLESLSIHSQEMQIYAHGNEEEHKSGNHDDEDEENMGWTGKLDDDNETQDDVPDLPPVGIWNW